MKADRASRTAQFVTLGRAMANAGLSHVPGFSDPTAGVFLSERGKKSVVKAERAFKQGTRRLSVEMARVMADTIALRTVAIDAAVREAIAAGATQLVIVGAGYDGRAWRMPELAGVKVFEVDHPATQREKRARVAELPAAKGTVTFVSTKFEDESLDTVLKKAGHDQTSPTCWIWEGVVMYLPHDVMLATLASIARRSAPGSTLIVNYHTIHRQLLAQIMFRLIGEPQVSAWSPDEMAADLRSAGFTVREDSGMVDWSQRFAHGQTKADRTYYMRIAAATLV